MSFVIIVVLIVVVRAPVLVLSEHALGVIDHGRNKALFPSGVAPAAPLLARTPFENSDYKGGHPGHESEPEEYSASLFGTTPPRKLSFEGISQACMGVIVGVLATWLGKR